MADKPLIAFLLEHAADAGVSAVVSAGVSFAVTKLTERSQKRSRRAEAIDELIEQISECAVAYWRQVGQIPEKEEKLIGNLEKLDERINLHLRRSQAEELQGDLDKITDWITGGTFQTANRLADPERAKIIKAELRGLRKALGA